MKRERQHKNVAVKLAAETSVASNTHLAMAAMLMTPRDHPSKVSRATRRSCFSTWAGTRNRIVPSGRRMAASGGT